jgi:hypothetical protein
VSGMFFDNPKSMKKIFPDGEMTLVCKNEQHYVNIGNMKETEVFSAQICPGSKIMSFSIFVVQKKTDEFKENIFKKLNNVDAFKTGKGIKLGMSKVEVIKILGGGFEITTDKDTKIIKYTIEGMEKSKILQKYNAPEYFGEYVFQKDKLIKMSFGFPCQ